MSASKTGQEPMSIQLGVEVRLLDNALLLPPTPTNNIQNIEKAQAKYKLTFEISDVWYTTQVSGKEFNKIWIYVSF